MKKAVAIIFVVVMMMNLVVSVAEEIDISSLTLEELLFLQIRVQDEIASRDPFSDFVLFPGRYVSGKHFEPGTYIINALSSENDEWLIVEIRNSDDEFVDSRVMKIGMNIQFDLDEGFRLFTTSGNITMIKR